MKSTDFLMSLYGALAVDLNLEEQDILTLKCRIRCEGLTFTSEVLPSLAKATLIALESKQFDCPLSFKRQKSSVLPLFLGQHFRVLFTDWGSLKPVSKAQASALYAIRQICELSYKADFPYSREKEQSVLSNFLATEDEIKKTMISFDTPILALAQEFISKLFRGFKFTPLGDFGPGVCADANQQQKHAVARVDSKALREYHDSFFWNGMHKMEHSSIKMTHSSLFDAELCAKVILVNKDARGPRLICAEPTTNQWLQMPLMDQIVKWVEGHPLTRGHVGFTEQWINGALSLENSESRQWATLDLKDASDRVRLDLVQFLFAHTTVLKPLLASRTGYADVDGKKIRLAKFAPMGSACCFPVMSIVIWAITCASISMDRNRLIYSNMYVYGDDLIVPTSDLFVIREALEYVGLRFNPLKCFDEAYFRESCGVDAYYGVDVTPVRLRRVPLENRPVKQNVASLIDFSNELTYFPNAQDYIRRLACSLLGKPIAYSAASIPGTFRVDYYDANLSLNTKGRYIVKRCPLQAKRTCSNHAFFALSFKRIGKEVHNDVSDVDLRKQKYTTRRIRVTEWRSDF